MLSARAALSRDARTQVSTLSPLTSNCNIPLDINWTTFISFPFSFYKLAEHFARQKFSQIELRLCEAGSFSDQKQMHPAPFFIGHFHGRHFVMPQYEKHRYNPVIVHACSHTFMAFHLQRMFSKLLVNAPLRCFRYSALWHLGWKEQYIQLCRPMTLKNINCINCLCLWGWNENNTQFILCPQLYWAALCVCVSSWARVCI